MQWLRPIHLRIANLGAIFRFVVKTFESLVQGGVPWRLLLDELYECGVRSWATTTATGFFVGAIMAIQIELQLRNFGAEGSVGGVATSVTLRNVGPVLIGFILVGKVGAMTTAILGTMRVTDQIDALTCLGVNPLRVVVAPRLLASILSSFFLLIIGLVVAIGGGVTIANFSFGVNPIHYVSQIPKFVAPWSVGTGVVKSLVFGTLIGTIACYRGYSVTGGAAAVGKAVRDASVTSLVSIVVMDCLISFMASTVHGWVRY